MASVTVNDIVNFARRVEGLCDFLLQGLEKDGSDDVVVIQKLKEDSADLQFLTRNSNVSIEGLDNHIRGMSHTTKE